MTRSLIGSPIINFAYHISSSFLLSLWSETRCLWNPSIKLDKKMQILLKQTCSLILSTSAYIVYIYNHKWNFNNILYIGIPPTPQNVSNIYSKCVRMVRMIFKKTSPQTNSLPGPNTMWTVLWSCMPCCIRLLTASRYLCIGNSVFLFNCCTKYVTKLSANI